MAITANVSYQKRIWVNTSRRAKISPTRFVLWSCGGEHVLCTWGYATRNQQGMRNTFDCEVLLSYWKGDERVPEGLPNITDYRWKSICGFDMPRKNDNGVMVTDIEAFIFEVRKRVNEIDEYI